MAHAIDAGPSSMKRLINYSVIALSLILTSQQCLALDRTEAFISSLDVRVPELLVRYGAPSAAVAVIHDGQTYTRTWGVADLDSGRLPSDNTLYNVASISKVVTAWAIMRLVQERRVSLDAPISKYVSRWRLPASAWNNEVTIRRLLSHTAGLSMPAVPQYESADKVPKLEEMLSGSKDPVRINEKPGTSYGYSGAGFAILQILIEEVTHQSYDRYVETQILRPIGMTHSTFKVPVKGAATPYDKSLKKLPHYYFAATGAAGLYTTITDMAAFARASLNAPGPGITLPLNAETITLMQKRTTVEKSDPFGYALGYNLVPLPVEGEAIGHSGSNDGWTSVISIVPSTGDALVVLLNRSDAFFVYRDLMCSWVESLKGKNWPGFCNNNSVKWTSNDTNFADAMFQNIHAGDPAVAILVATSEGVVYQKAFGTADVATGAPVSPNSPFYIASLTKSLTSLVALKLVEKGRWSLSDPIGKFIPELPSYAKDATIDQLLSHTSGIPDYYGLIDWSTYKGMDNTKVIALLNKRSALEFAAGSQYKYSNSGYVLVATAIERLTGLPYRQVLSEKVLKPMKMDQTLVFDGSSAAPDSRAKGYVKDNDRYVLSDYQVVTIGGEQLPYRATTYGAGGVYSTLDDLYSFSQALDHVSLLSLPLQTMATSPRTTVASVNDLPNVIGHGLGWFSSRMYDTNVIWNTGDMLGHKSAVLRIPKERLTIIVLSSAAGREPEIIAKEISDHLLEKPASKK
jgi:CubicO group peptidase (beta-lactamase class C family)